MSIKLILARTELKEIEVEGENISDSSLKEFVTEEFPGFEVVDIIRPGEERKFEDKYS